MCVEQLLYRFCPKREDNSVAFELKGIKSAILDESEPPQQP